MAKTEAAVDFGLVQSPSGAEPACSIPTTDCLRLRAIPDWSSRSIVLEGEIEADNADESCPLLVTATD